MSADGILCNICGRFAVEAADQLVARTDRIRELEEENDRLKSRIAEIRITGVSQSPNHEAEQLELSNRIKDLEGRLRATDEFLVGLMQRLEDTMGLLSPSGGTKSKSRLSRLRRLASKHIPLNARLARFLPRHLLAGE